MQRSYKAIKWRTLKVYTTQFSDTALFLILVAIAQRKTTSKYYNSELTPFPMLSRNQIKQFKHIRRSLNKRGCTGVQCDVSTKVNIKQVLFLPSSTNKYPFIYMLSIYLIKSGHKVIKCDEDADTKIVRCAFDAAETGRRVKQLRAVQMLLSYFYHWNENKAGITITSERSKTIVQEEMSKNQVPCDFFSRSNCYTFLESWGCWESNNFFFNF